MCDFGKASSNVGLELFTEEEAMGEFLGVHPLKSSSKPSIATSGLVEVDTIAANRVHEEERR